MPDLDLPRRPEARTVTVEGLIALVMRGKIRVPWFQRGLNWENTHVRDLFDSIYHGYPIGSLLFYVQRAAAERVWVGPLPVDADETPEGWWVVDGQQRVTSLAAALGRPLPLPPKPEDPYVVYFDAAEQKFFPSPSSGEPDSTWIPLPVLLDASRLNEWVFQWSHRDDEELRRRAFEAGSRLREYGIPLYLIETDDPEITHEIFYRTNKSGKPLEWKDVHKALFGGSESSPSTLAELDEELAAVGMGKVGEDRLLTCLFALRGMDPTRSFDEHYRSRPNALRDAVLDALPVLRRVLSFLRQECAVPHLRLLPKSILLDVLTRFFALHAEPKPRTRLLLSRWYWRAVLGAGIFDDRTLRRRGIQAVQTGDEEESIQELLALTRKQPPRPIALPPAFDARADASRIVLLALAHGRPRHLTEREPLDLPAVIDEHEKRSFRKILTGVGLPEERGAANRIIHPPGVSVRKTISTLALTPSHGPNILDSHYIDDQAAEALAERRYEDFLTIRGKAITLTVQDLTERLASWNHTDRPSIEHLLLEAGVES